MKIPLSKVTFEKKEITKVIEVMNSGWLTHGKYNKIFEQEFCKYLNVKHSLTLNSCTSALELAIKSLNIKREVIVPSFTWVSSANAIISAGAKPVFCDVDIKTGNVTAENILPLITKKTEAIMVVHYAGQCCNMDEIYKLCKKKKLILIEDSAETLGGKWKNKMSGSWGIGCFSFFPTKNITTGEGGMITCSNLKLYKKFKSIAAHGIKSQTIERERSKLFPWIKISEYAGHNYRMSNILAAIGYVQIKKIDKLNYARKKSAKIYDNLIDDSNLPIIKPYKHKYADHVYQTYAIKVEPKYRNNLLLYLRKNNIGASVHFTPPLHKQSFYKKNCIIRCKFENTEALSNSLISLPMHSKIRKNELYFVFEKIQKFFRHGV